MQLNLDIIILKSLIINCSTPEHARKSTHTALFSGTVAIFTVINGIVHKMGENKINTVNIFYYQSVNNVMPDKLFKLFFKSERD